MMRYIIFYVFVISSSLLSREVPDGVREEFDLQALAEKKADKPPVVDHAITKGSLFNFVENNDIKVHGSEQNISSDIINFTFDDADLSEVVMRYADKKGVNVIMPQGQHAMDQKITFHPTHPFTLEEAERYMYLFLDLGGYLMRPGPNSSYNVVMKNDPNVRRHPLPLYINIDPKQLPDSDELIRAVYYLNNLRVSDIPGNQQNAVNAILN